MFAKVYEVEGEYMVAACEKSLIGKTFKDGKITLKVTEDFYKGDEVSEDKLLEMLNNATIANLVGKPVDIAIKHNLVNEDGVMKISGVKHAQICIMK
ncbi:MAG: DUF424 domain-containing protein [Candidatus Altiarchaeales archaeon HGW-Altiarchaeales-1]|nr:MAG: DUF424 domain-containing protein [Candidatus Altiarchaeales archaeon HGW-Altiarchaeales-1]